jgi:hypothetical protein
MGRFSIALLEQGEYFSIVKCIAPGADTSEKFASSAKNLKRQINLRADLLFDGWMVHQTILERVLPVRMLDAYRKGFFFVGANRSPQPGQSISSKLPRLISRNSMIPPHSGHDVIRAAKTLSSSIFIFFTVQLAHAGEQ